MDNIIIMSELTFPSGITWEQNYITGGDFLPAGVTAINDKRWINCNNNVIKNNVNTTTQKSFQNYFYKCSFLTIPPELDTSSATDASNMFNDCTNIQTTPQYNFENVTDVSYLFSNCSKLLTVPDLNLKKVTSLQYIFYSCNNLISIGVIDCDSVVSVSSPFGYSSITTLVNAGGFRNLGAKSSLSGTTSSFIDYMPNLTRQSLLNIFNLLYDRASAGYSVVTLKLHANHHAKLTDEDKAIATNKGWALS